jgi:eukaryotic-like serine/threonine-protein kinase
LGEIVPNLPAEMEKIILRCLRKDPDRRTRHMDDVKLAIEDLKEESESGGVASLIGVTSSRRRPYAKSSSIRVAVIAAGVVVSIAGAVVAWRAARRFPGAQFTSNTVLTRLTNDSGLTTDPALSPDGKLVAYASDREGHGNLDIWVQQVSGGQAIQLTHDAADDREPSFSPDGTRIALRSERDGGGIYVVSTFGGEEKLVARQGRRPRFSPDGSKIAYWVGNVGGDPSVSGTSKIYTVASTGGSPQQLGPGLPVARYPIWSADGKQILFWGIGNASGRESTEDWWVIPVAGRQAVETGAFAEFRRAGLQEPLGAYMIIPADWAVLQDRVMFAAQFGDSTNVWQIPIGVDGRAVGAPQRLTSGSGLEMYPAGGARGSFVFSSLQNRIDLWTLPVDANRARVGGDAQRLTDDASLHLAPVVAANGTRVAFISKRSGTWEVWVKDLASGKLSSVAVLPSIIGWPAISAEGSTVAYVAHQGVNNPKNEIFTTPATGGQSERVCAGCNAAYSFSSDGKRMLIWQMNWVRLL